MSRHRAQLLFAIKPDGALQEGIKACQQLPACYKKLTTQESLAMTISIIL